MKIDYQESLSSMPQPLTLQRWNEMTRSEAVNSAVADFQHGDAKAKKRLPAVMWQASFGGKRRSNANAIPSGLYMLDLDHLEGNTAQIYTERVAPHIRECGIVLIHTTPSGHGLRVVARMRREQGFSTIREFQLWLAAQLGFKPEEVDQSTKDMARLSFVPPEPYVHFLDQSLFIDEPEYVLPMPQPGNAAPSAHSASAHSASAHGQKTECTRKAYPAATPATSADATSADAASGAAAGDAGEAEDAAASAAEGDQKGYKGIPLTDIAQRLVENMFGDTIHEGTRNASLYKVARVMRYVCDFNAETMADALPHYGLDHAEVLSLCRSACDSFRRTDLPTELTVAVEELLDEREEDEEAENEGEEDVSDRRPFLSLAEYQRKLPPLPPLFKEYVGLCPPDFKAVQLLSMLPVVGTLCTAVRAVYLDGCPQSPSFITVVTAPQASGKSFARKMYKSLTKRIKAEDDTNRAIEEAYRQELKSAKNAKEQPVDPRACIRLLPPSVSVAKLLQRLDYAGQRHLLTFAEEIDTLTKSNSSGAWAQKSDLYRNAFDNAEYGQDYMSDSSYSTVVEVYYNLLVLGTPRAVGRFFRDVEDGLVSRVIFAEIPSQMFKRMPRFKRMSAAAEARCDEMVGKLMAMGDDYDLEYLNRAIEDWLELRRLDGLHAQNEAIDIFRRRAAVMGFRAGLVARACYEAAGTELEANGTYRSRIKRFATWVADYALASLLSRFDERMEKVQTETMQTKKSAVNYVNIFDKIDSVFSSDMLRTLLRYYGVKTRASMVIYRWKANGIIQRVEGRTGYYRKI